MFKLTDRHIEELLVTLQFWSSSRQQSDLKVSNLSIYQFVDLQMTELPS